MHCYEDDCNIWYLCRHLSSVFQCKDACEICVPRKLCLKSMLAMRIKCSLPPSSLARILWNLAPSPARSEGAFNKQICVYYRSVYLNILYWPHLALSHDLGGPYDLVAASCHPSLHSVVLITLYSSHNHLLIHPRSSTSRPLHTCCLLPETVPPPPTLIFLLTL